MIQEDPLESQASPSMGGKLEKVDSRDEGNQTNFATLPLDLEPGSHLMIVDPTG